MEESPLQTPRTLITNIFDTLTASQPQAQINANIEQVNEPYTPITNSISPPYTNRSMHIPTNPLAMLPPSHRALLTTLHVLFPSGTLLQALDLLDRGLVSRVILRIREDGEEGGDKEGDDIREREREGEKERHAEVLIGEVVPPQATIHLPPSQPSNLLPPSKPKPKTQLYKVQSSQPPKSRFATSTSTNTNMTYTINLLSWNCTCAAFTFEAFPATYTSAPWLPPYHPNHQSNSQVVKDKQGELEFGGKSNDGMGVGGNVPICKHLLACFLAERWSDVLGGFVKERVVGREEMGGLGGEG